MRIFAVIVATVIISLLNSNVALGQEIIEITYKVSLKAYKNRDTKTKNNTKLFIYNNSSIFIDENTLLKKRAFTKNSSRDEKARDLAMIPVPHFKEIVFKEYEAGTLTVIAEHLGNESIAYSSSQMSPESWDILYDTDSTITGLKVFKATCDNFGRKWSAWFAPEIASSDGPYKFGGLPGLIIKLDSGDGEYSFQISGLQKLTSYNTSILLPTYKTVSKGKFDELQKYLKENPFAMMESMGGRIDGNISVNGKSITKEEFGLLLIKDFETFNSIEKD